MGECKLSPTTPCSKPYVALSLNGRLFAVEHANQIIIYSCSTLAILTSVQLDGSTKFEDFCPDSKYFSWLCTSSSSIKLYEVETQNLLEIEVKQGLDVVALLWGNGCLLYISELEIYIGVYDLARHSSFTLEGCSLNDFGSPLLSFSPLKDYLCFCRDHRVVLYDTHRWELKVVVNCSNCVMPVFASPYVLFLANSEGTVDWYAVTGMKIKTSLFGSNSSILDTKLSKDGRTLFASTWDNKVLAFDTLLMKKKFEWSYIFNLKEAYDVRGFISTNQTDVMGFLKLQHFELCTTRSLKELKNLLDEFKRKTQFPHLMALNSRDNLLATFNPTTPLAVWIWDFSNRHPLKSLVYLDESAGKVTSLQWHGNMNRLAISCSNIVIIWSEADRLIAFRGESIDFKWLNQRIPIGAIALEKFCTFAYFT